MELTDIEKQAKALMTLHGVGSLEFAFDRGTRRIAACHMARIRSVNGSVNLAKKITLSKRWAMVLPAEEIREVMLHEIAHALTLNDGKPHGPAFQSAVRKIGGKATGRCFSPSVNIDGSPRN